MCIIIKYFGCINITRCFNVFININRNNYKCYRKFTTRASQQAAALEEISGPTARVLSLALRAADRGS